MLNILDPKWQLFVKVADAGSVTAAALALDIHQSVVSRHIARLEEESGTRLFRRTGRGLVLTEFGEQVYSRVMPLIRDAEQLADDMRTRKDTPVGELRFGATPRTNRIARWLASHAAERMHVTQSAMSGVLARLREDRAARAGPEFRRPAHASRHGPGAGPGQDQLPDHTGAPHAGRAPAGRSHGSPPVASRSR